jgi:hypothetical protein
MSSFRKFHSIAALCGDGLRPELQALFERLAVDPRSELFTRRDGMVQSGPDPVAAPAPVARSTGEHGGVAGNVSVRNSGIPALVRQVRVRP